MSLSDLKLENIKFEISDQVAWIKFNRPHALNALNLQTLHELNRVLEEMHSESFDQVKALVLIGEGGKAFVAGADIKEIQALTPQKADEFSSFGQMVFRKLEKLHVPVIAAVGGYALGGGLELALACDFIVASSQAKFGLPEVSLGLIPGFGGTVRLARAVGINRAREIIFTGRMISAEEAQGMGLVSQVVAPEALLARVQEICNQIKTRGPVAIQKSKEVILKAFDRDIDSGLEVEARGFSTLFYTQDFQEGTKAFLEKREPQFSGK